MAEPMANVALYQKALGHNVLMACECGRSLEFSLMERGLDVIPDLRLSGRLNPFEIRRDVHMLRSVIDTFHPDVIHCHLLHDHWVAALALRGRDPRPLLVRTLHKFTSPYHDPIHKILFTKLTDGIIAPSQAMHTMFLECYPHMEDRVHAIPGGVNLQRFHPDSDGLAIRRQLNISPDEPVAGLVSRLRNDRGLHWLFDSLKLVFSKNPRIRFIIVGRGEMDLEVRHWITHEPFRDRVIMAGYRKRDLQDAYAAMNAALFLAQGSEGGSRSIMEAMGCARPVIAATCGAVPEMIRDSVTGYLVTKDDAGALADRILDILKDTKRAADMGREARIFAENRYRLLERAEQIMDFYEALQSRKS